MPLTLNIGVVDVPYSTPEGGGKPNRATTGDVAGYVERKYGLFTKFYEFDQEKIAAHMADSLAGALESAALGAPTADDPFAAAGGAIAADFRQFLTEDVIATMGVAGVPTKAALDGVNHRLKTKKGASRSNFIDTGTMQSALVAWVERT